MSRFQSITRALLETQLALVFFSVATDAQTVGVMDTHVRMTVPTEKEEFITNGICTAFQPSPSSEVLDLCSRLIIVIQTKKLEEAKELAEKLNRLNPGNGLGAFWLGYIEFILERKLTGLKYLEDAAERSPEVPLAHLNLGLGYLKGQQYALFEKEMRWVIAHQAENPRPYYLLGRFYAEELDRLDEGADYLLEALRRNPEDYRSRFHLGLALEMKGEIEKAKAEYEKAAALADSCQAIYAYPLEGLARLCWRQQRPSDALRYAREVVLRDPKLASGRMMLGNLYLQTGAKEEAVAELRAATELSPDDPTPHYVLAKAYRKLGMSAEAQHEEDTFKRLKATCPDK
ncbi:MAG TPA: tetratricopeptide repeat protein [Terriglobia bacterium]|nr:tetratricopeptide repeat protein [Terriglobia bacterium]